MKFKRFCMVSLSLILTAALSISCVFASTYVVDPDTELIEQPPIYYTEDYEPGLITALKEQGIALYANASYGSYSMSGVTPYINYSIPSAGSRLRSLVDSVPTVSVSSSGVTAAYSNLFDVESIESGFLSLVLSNNAYFDFQSSNFTFTQDTAQADTFILDGTFTFQLQNLYSVTQTNTTAYYGALDPIAVQLLVDGQPYGDIFDVTSYTSPFTGAFTGSPANASVSFDNVKVYGVESAPELIGFRIYVDSNYGGTRSIFSGQSLVSVSVSNTLRVISQPSMSFERESTASDEDLSAILDVLNSIYNQLFDSSYSLSWLERIFNQLRDSSNNRSWFATLSDKLTQSNVPLLGENGAIFAGTYTYSLAHIARNGFLGLATFLRPLESAVNDYVFSWRDYNLDTHSLGSSQSITGQNLFFQNVFQSIEENLGRLTYVFASDDEIELRDEASPSVDQFKESFGGGASAGDILEVADSVGEVQGMFNTGFGVNDLWDSLKGESWWSWFTTENAQALDSTGQPAAVGDEDPFNMQTYYDHLHAVEEIRSREEDE